MENKTERISCRVTKKQKETIEHHAKQSGLSVSDYVAKSAINGKSRIRNSKQDAIRKHVLIQNELNKVISIAQINEQQQMIQALQELQREMDSLWKL